MEILTQPNNQTKSESSFDRASRESYFEMHEVAFRNLSMVDPKKEDQVVLVYK